MLTDAGHQLSLHSVLIFFQLAKRKERREEAQKGLAQAEEAGELTYPAGIYVKHLLGSMIRSPDHGQ